jgi:osmotically-inducible protein OsmY
MKHLSKLNSSHLGTQPKASLRRPMAAALWVLAAALPLGGCAPLLLGGAMVGGTLVATDRRTTGIQLEDESIELKAAARVRGLATLGQVSVTSYNRILLLTGEVPSEREKQAVEQAVAGVENVRNVVNELAVTSNSRLGERSNDAWITTKIKASMVDAKDLQANAYKVVVDRGIVYLMGRVSEREATRGAELARAIPGVQKVVRVFELMSEEELSRLGRAGAGAGAAASAAPPRN